MSEPYMKMAEIEKLYRNLWVLIDEPRLGGRHELLGGRVVLHHADGVEFQRLFAEWDDRTGGTHNVATLYMGTTPVGEAVPIESEPGAA